MRLSLPRLIWRYWQHHQNWILMGLTLTHTQKRRTNCLITYWKKFSQNISSGTEYWTLNSSRFWLGSCSGKLIKFSDAKVFLSLKIQNKSQWHNRQTWRHTCFRAYRLFLNLEKYLSRVFRDTNSYLWAEESIEAS